MPLHQQQQQRKGSSLSPKKRHQQTSNNHREKVLLGYDVVAGLLDNDKTSLLNDENYLSESYLDGLVSFRKNNLDQSNSSYALSKWERIERSFLFIEDLMNFSVTWIWRIFPKKLICHHRMVINIHIHVSSIAELRAVLISIDH